jgi:hypothetical protein
MIIGLFSPYFFNAKLIYATVDKIVSNETTNVNAEAYELISSTPVFEILAKPGDKIYKLHIN